MKTGAMFVVFDRVSGNAGFVATIARVSKDQRCDSDILNAALGAELSTIAANQLGAGLLPKPVLDLALQLLGHHKEYADALPGAV